MRNFKKENEQGNPEGEMNHQIISRSNEITAILNKYSDEPRNLVIIDDSDADIDEAAEITSTTQKRALNTKIETTTTRTRTRTNTRTSTRIKTSSIHCYEDIEPLKIISQVFNDSLQPINQHQRIYERPSSEGAHTSCPSKQLNLIDNTEIIPGHHHLKTRMNPRHISEINGIDEDKEKEGEKGLPELIAERGDVHSDDSISICHIDDLNLAEVKPNVSSFPFVPFALMFGYLSHLSHLPHFPHSSFIIHSFVHSSIIPITYRVVLSFFLSFYLPIYHKATLSID